VTRVPCNLCGADDFDIVFRAGQAQSNQIVRCRACGLMYANPRTSPLDAAAVAAHDPEYLAQMLQRPHDLRMDKEALQVRDYIDTTELLRRCFPARGRLLEVGCGLGFLLDHFRRDGWRVQGVDPDPLMARHAQQVLGLEVAATTLPQAGLAEASFEAVLMMNVIEHVDDPAATLRQAYRLLKPGGMLVVETPRLDSMMFRLFGPRERNVACEGHVYFFTTGTFAAMARRGGFALVQSKVVGRSMTLDRLLWHMGQISRRVWLQRRLEHASRIGRLDAVRLRLNVRDIQRVSLRRPANAVGAETMPAAPAADPETPRTATSACRSAA
jgi:SAM-dependent methyltransferase